MEPLGTPLKKNLNHASLQLLITVSLKAVSAANPKQAVINTKGPKPLMSRTKPLISLNKPETLQALSPLISLTRKPKPTEAVRAPPAMGNIF